MKKQLILLVTLMMVSVGFLSGCNEQKTVGKNVPPIVTFSVNATSGFQPLNINFIVNASDEDGFVANCIIDFGDGGSSSNFVANHTYYAGSYNVTISVFDDEGLTTVKYASIFVKNKGPTVEIIVDDTSGLAPFTVFFDTNATDTDGTIISYIWNFDDGETGAQKSVFHTFKEVGNYSVTVTSFDNDGGSAQDDILINVTPSNFTLKPIADSYVDVNNPDTNFGGAENLDVEFSDYGYGIIDTQYSYLLFDLSDIPSDVVIDTATLRLYCWLKSDATDNVKVHKSNVVNWEESTLKWNNKPSYSSSSTAVATVITSEKWYEWDVKNYIQTSLSTGKVTLVLDTSIHSAYSWFYSKDSTYTSKTPELYIKVS